MFKGLSKNIVHLNEEEEAIFEKNIVWLFGHPRGGTTWTALQLLSYNTNYVNEPHIDDHIGVRAAETSGRFVRRIDNPQNNSEYFFSSDYKDTWMHYLKKLLLHRFYAQTKDIYKKTIIKEVCVFGSADIISECMKNSKLIILVRDGRDQIDSLVDARSNVGFMTKAGNEPITKESSQKQNTFVPVPTRRIFITNQSKSWVIRSKNFLKAYNNHPKELRYKLKYEDLLGNTLNELRKLYDFIEINITNHKLQEIINKFSFANIPESEKGQGKFARSATPGKWKENFSIEERKILLQEMGKMLKKLGYKI